MAGINDVMPVFELFQPASLDEALVLADEHRDGGWLLAGGMDSFDWLKDRSKRAAALIDLSRVSDLHGIRPFDDGLEIGAMTTLTEVVRHPDIRAKYQLLSTAAELVASPQIRHQGTIGGNVTQDARCWYYRSGWDCYRAGGNICYADTPTAMNREHAILDAYRCVAVNPSDTAPALVALDATMVVRSRQGERTVPARDYFVGPATDITRMHVLAPGELLTAIRLPGTWAGVEFYFEKIRDREVWDFALVNVAAAIVAANGRFERVSLVVNGVAATPRRLDAVERAVTGAPRTRETAEMAGRLAVEGAVPLRHNGYKVPLMRNLVRRALLGSRAEDVTT